MAGPLGHRAPSAGSAKPRQAEANKHAQIQRQSRIRPELPTECVCAKPPTTPLTPPHPSLYLSLFLTGSSPDPFTC